MTPAFVEPRLLRRSLTVLLALAAAAQVGGLAWTSSHRLARLPGELELFWAPQPVAAPNAPILAFRALRPRGGLMPRIPEDGRTLLVTAVVAPVQFQFYFLPRPFRVLMQLDDAVVAAAERLAPEHAHLIRDRRRALDARGTRLSAQRLAEDLAWAQHLVVFGAPPDLLVPRLQQWEEVARVESTVLYRARPR